MNLDSALLTVFTTEITDDGGGPVIDLPDRELDLGALEIGETYRVAIEATSTPTRSDGRVSTTTESGGNEPPVAVGETHEVEIDDVGEEGDGVARVGPGYIVFVPDAGMGDRVTIEITNALENFAFGEVVEDEPVDS